MGTVRLPPAPLRVNGRDEICRRIEREWKARWVAASTTATATEPALVTVPNVELLEVGENWVTSTGVFTWTVEHLQAAVAAQADPSIRTPVIKLGHVDARFDGQPSIGRIENMRLSNNDQTLVGDLVGVPYWLAACMASAFPRRSIEGFFDFPTRTGNTWAFALTGVALLGDAYPAIDTLEDVRALFGKDPPVLVPVENNEQIIASLVAVDHGDMRVAVPLDSRVAASWAKKTGDAVAATDIGNTTTCTRSGCGHPGSMHNDTTAGDNNGACNATGCDCSAMMTGTSAGAPRRVAADVAVSDVVNAFYDEGPGGEPGNYWWWIREVRVDPAEVIVDDDEGHLYRVPYTIGSGDGQGAVAFGEPQEVRIQYVNVTAAAATIQAKYGDPVAAGRPRRKETRASDDGPANRKETDVKLSADVLKRFGLTEDATEDDINAALLAATLGDAPVGDGTGGDGAPATGDGAPAAGETGAGGDGSQPSGTGTTGGDTSETTIPDGMVLVDASLLNDLKTGAALAKKHEETNVKAERTRVVDDAIKAGKIAASRRDFFLDRMEIDADGTKAWLSKTEAIIPVEERGYAGDPAEVAAAGGTGESQTDYPESWKPMAAAARRTAASRIKAGRD